MTQAGYAHESRLPMTFEDTPRARAARDTHSEAQAATAEKTDTGAPRRTTTRHQRDGNRAHFSILKSTQRFQHKLTTLQASAHAKSSVRFLMKRVAGPAYYANHLAICVASPCVTRATRPSRQQHRVAALENHKLTIPVRRHSAGNDF